MLKKKIVIFKNDRGGDLLVSLKAIYALMENNSNVTIYLSNINKSFSFLFKNSIIKEIPFDLTIFSKLKIFLYFLVNKVDEVYILTPKNFYYYLPFIFRKIKFYGIVIEGKKRNRPSNFFKKYLYKYKIISRKDKINKETSDQIQLSLVTEDIKNKNDILKSIDLSFVNNAIKSNLFKSYVFFQFKKSFFDKLEWDLDKLDLFFNSLIYKNLKVVFCSDIKNNSMNKNFLKKYSYINFKTNEVKKNITKNILYLHDISGKDLFYVINQANNVICPHGLISHISSIYMKPTLALFNFEIKNKSDFLHEKVSLSEWYPKKSFNFTFLNRDFKRTMRKFNNLT
tara:strand:- start:2162 stop:3181 length:1020 start_codon:yes stop_codon:yes gene_type:complete